MIPIDDFWAPDQQRITPLRGALRSADPGHETFKSSPIH
jgi:hypothetical protein